VIRRSLIPPARKGYVLYIVLVVVVVLTLVAYQYADSMASEAAAATRAHELEQAKANAVSGVYYAAAVLTDPSYHTYNLDDDPGQFRAVPVGTANTETDQTTPRWQGDVNKRRGGGLVSLMNLSDTTGGTDGSYPDGLLRYGLEDEGRKLNVNALILLDPTGAILYEALMRLPNMTAEVAGAVVDWLDADPNEYPTGGAEDDFYMGLDPAYHCKNGPVNSVEELLLVKGVTPELLFGADRNRNGVQDPEETASGQFGRGWVEYLTCYGREINADATGIPRLNLNTDDLVLLDEQLMSLEGMTREVADYLLYYRLSGRGEAVQATLPAGRVLGTAADLRGLVDNALKSGTAIPRRRLTSAFTVLNTQIPLPAGAAQPGQPAPPVIVVPCPLNDQKTMTALASVMLDKLTANDDYELVPRVNVNTAPREVIACLPGLADEDVEAIMTNRPTSTTDPTAAWLVTTAGLNLSKFKNIERFVCGRSGAYRVRSVGYFGTPGGPTASVEAVIEVVVEDADGMGAVARPRIVMFRDTTDLGRVFTDLPR
jgi:type II secretory pathway component PulK